MLILVRHGRTSANAAGVLQGRSDLPLDEVGMAQAVAAAAAVGPIDRVVSSPLRRARETAARFGQAVAIDERWVEIDYGEYEGRPMREVPDDEWLRWRTEKHYVSSGGESLGQVEARVRDACEELAADAVNRNVVVVSHVSPIKAAVAWALGVDVLVAWRCHLDQAAICRVAIRSDGPVLMSFNESP
jgi:probable phosphoglycerate mutase